MAKLSINPISQLVQKFDSNITEALAAAQSGIPSIGNLADKIKLDDLTSKLSGGLNSGLNQAVAMGGNFTNQLTTGLGNIKNLPTSALGDSPISSLTNIVGGGFGGALNQTEGLLGGAAAAGKIGALASKLTGGNLAGGASNLANTISRGAGVLNDLLSLRRGANLPKNGELFSSSGEGIQVVAKNDQDWRIRIACDWSAFLPNPMFEELKLTGGAVFPILPNITFATKANYTQIDPVHNNYPFQAYKNSQVDEISIQGTFLAENSDQAGYWIAVTTFFKTMTKMFFGQGANVGAPPPICTLNGYGASIFDNVPIVIKSFSVDFASDVNYIKCDKYGTSTWVPITSSINVTCMPVYNRRNLREFSLVEYAKGNLKTPSKKGYI